MMINLLSTADPSWLRWISDCPQATIFHHPAWTDLLTRCYKYKSSLLVKTNQPAQIVAGIPLMEINSRLTGRRLVSLPFSDSCQPIANDSTALDELVLGLQTHRQQCHFSEFEVRWPLKQQSGVYAGESFVQHITRLENDPEQVFRRFKRTQVQQCIRQAEKAGVIVHRGEGWEDVQKFYRLHLQTRQRLGVPVQPLRYFRLLWEHLIAQKLGFVLLAYKDTQLLAGAIFLHWNKTLTYKYSASEPAFWKLRPNNLVLWHAIRWGCENGYQVFDWGRTDLEDVGLRDFKRGWGSEERLLQYTILADRPPASRLGGGAQKRILQAVIQHSPKWVCRLIGEILYVHFG